MASKFRVTGTDVMMQRYVYGFPLCFQPRLRKNCWKMLGETSVFVSPRSILNRLQLQKDHCHCPATKNAPPQKSQPIFSHVTGVGASWTLAHLLVG